MNQNQYEKIRELLRQGVIPYCVLSRKDIPRAAEIMSFIRSHGTKRIAVARAFEETWTREDRQELGDSLHGTDADVYVYPEVVSCCKTCYPKSMIVYPDGEVYDLCYVCAAVDGLDKNVFRFGHLDNCGPLLLDVAKKRTLITANRYCPTPSPL